MRALFLAFLAVPALAQTAPKSLAFVGGHVFDGEQFVARDVFVEGGRFVAERPARVDTVLDVSGRFVVPPYGDFHHHTLDGPSVMDEHAARYLREGTFYTLNGTATPAGYRQARARFAPAGTLDARFAVALTSTYSHPQILIESVRRRYWGYFQRRLTPEQWATVRDDRIAEGAGYWLADDIAALDSVWAQILDVEPDALKLFLSDVASRPQTDDARGHGLRPDVVAEAVRRARAHGIPVLAHVETADDARIAVEAGVDALMHLPGYRIVGLSDAAWEAEKADGWARYRLDDETVRQMAERGVAVSPTVHLNAERAAWRYPDRPTRPLEARWVQFDQIRRLHASGVPIVVGLDGGDGTTWAEAAYMAEHGLFSPAEVLRMWAVVTPQTIFPDRQIGEVAPGYEASLLVLACDPLTDFDCALDIDVRVKDGVLLPEIPAREAPDG